MKTRLRKEHLINKANYHYRVYHWRMGNNQKKKGVNNEEGA